MTAIAATLTSTVVIPFVLSGNFAGRFYDADCGPQPARAYVAGLADVAQGHGNVPPVVIGAGDLFGPEPLTRYAIERDERTRDVLARGLAGAGGRSLWDALLPGDRDLAIGAVPLGAITEVAGLPWVAANLTLPFPAESERLVRRGRVIVGLTGVLHDAFRGRAQARGWNREWVGAAGALRTSLARLRAAGADVRVALVHVPHTAGASEVVRLIHELGDERPDLLLASGFDDVALIRLGPEAMPVVVAPAAPDVATLVRLSVPVHGGVRFLSSRRVPVEPRLEPSLEAARRLVCEDLTQPVSKTAAEGSVDRERFSRFVLDLMRRTTSAEIAVLHDEGIGRRFPLALRMDRLALHRACPLPDRMQIAEVRGADLGPIAALEGKGALVLGIASDGVAGRPLDPTRTYRVVASDFVARGGDGLLDPQRFAFARHTRRARLRDLVLEEVGTGKLDAFAGGAEPPVRQPALLEARYKVTGDLRTVSVDNPDDEYEAPQLSRNEFFGIGAVVDVRLIADLELHRFDLIERTRYGVARNAEDAPLEENDDVTTLELLYVMRLAGRGRPFWVPDASATLSLETELTVPESSDINVRNYRRFLFQAGAGPSWALAERLFARSQLGLRTDLGADPDSPVLAERNAAERRLALRTTVELLDLPLSTLGPQPLTLTARVDHTVDLTGAQRDSIIQARAEIDLPITGLLSLTASVLLYAQDRSDDARPGALDPALGFSVDSTIGLRASGDFAGVVF